MSPDEAMKAGLLRGLYDTRDQLLAAARELAAQPRVERSLDSDPLHVSQKRSRANSLAGLEAARNDVPDTEAAGAVLECVETGLRDGWQAALDAERRCLIRLRNTDEARFRLQAFLSKTTTKS